MLLKIPLGGKLLGSKICAEKGEARVYIQKKRVLVDDRVVKLCNHNLEIDF